MAQWEPAPRLGNGEAPEGLPDTGDGAPAGREDLECATYETDAATTQQFQKHTHTEKPHLRPASGTQRPHAQSKALLSQCA